MAEKLQLSKSDRQKVWWRSTFLQGSWNYERMQNLGWAYALIPAIKKLYTSKEDRAAALERHLEFFNTHPYVAAPIIGVTLALEEERANGAEIDDTAIQGVKIGMMGLALTFLCMWLLKKKVSPITIIIGLFIVGIAARFFGIM
ncbi:PTS system, mannose-specific IID component [Streptococcus infantarius subsp. infantarius]|nr:PTS system, mannose-specific IID component [Streptococcus infantarius subsp. infantarius]